MRVYLAGLDAGHLNSQTNGYTRAAAEVFPHVLVSFFFYVDPASHAKRSPQSIIPKESHAHLSDAGVGTNGT